MFEQNHFTAEAQRRGEKQFFYFLAPAAQKTNLPLRLRASAVKFLSTL